MASPPSLRIALLCSAAIGLACDSAPDPTNQEPATDRHTSNTSDASPESPTNPRPGTDRIGDPVADPIDRPTPAKLVLPDVKPIAERWWEDPGKHCPSGKSWGKPPPDGHSVWCQDDEGRVGPRTNWHDNGNKSSEGWEIDNEPAGPWKRWAKNGQLVEEFYSVPPGGQTGWYRAWDEAGELLGEYEIVDGNGRAKRWHKNGIVSEQGEVVTGLRHGIWSNYTDQGELRRTSSYANGLLHGPQEQFRPDGKRINESHFDRGEMHGLSTIYDPENGQVRQVTRHVHGRGGVTTYYQDGEPLGVRPEDTGAMACNTDESLSDVLVAQGHPPLPERHRCVSRSRSFAGVIQLGSFAHDRGCRATATVLDCKNVEGKLDAQTILERGGWARATPDNRKAIAERYVREIATTYSGSITSDPEPMKTVAQANGSVVLTAWKARPSGMRRGRTVDLMQYSFSAKGRLASKVLETRDERPH